MKMTKIIKYITRFKLLVNIYDIIYIYYIDGYKLEFKVIDEVSIKKENEDYKLNKIKQNRKSHNNIYNATTK